MDIQVWADVVCPWCYLGKRRLEVALTEHPGDVTVTYRAFQLDATPVPAPLPIKQAMAAKLGNADQMLAHVTSIAAAEGITIDYDRAIAANTFDAHRLIAWAATQGVKTASYIVDHDPSGHLDQALPASVMQIRAEEIQRCVGEVLGDAVVQKDPVTAQ